MLLFLLHKLPKSGLAVLHVFNFEESCCIIYIPKNIV
jgi:hypothetical protein